MQTAKPQDWNRFGIKLKRYPGDPGIDPLTPEHKLLYTQVPANRLNDYYWFLMECMAEKVEQFPETNGYKFVIIEEIEKGRELLQEGLIPSAQECAKKIEHLLLEVEMIPDADTGRGTKAGSAKGGKATGHETSKQASENTIKICKRYQDLLQNHPKHEVVSILVREFGFTEQTIRKHLKKK